MPEGFHTTKVGASTGKGGTLLPQTQLGPLTEYIPLFTEYNHFYIEENAFKFGLGCK
jgi:hypothetical protein